jgi:CHAT domain-containing protein
MPTTPDGINLASVEQEAKATQQSFAGLVTTTRLNKPSASDVLRQLGSHEIIHFACHGVSHPDDPARSALVLQRTNADAEAVPGLLTVQQVLESRSQPGQLAFLSACSTAENKVVYLADEVIHMTSSFFIAGFSHAVGLMWPSSDSVCVRVAERLYMDLAKGHL